MIETVIGWTEFCHATASDLMENTNFRVSKGILDIKITIKTEKGVSGFQQTQYDIMLVLQETS